MKKVLLLSTLSGAILLAGCNDAGKQAGQGAAPLVVGQQAQTIAHQQSKSYIGRVEAVEDTEITAQVTGYLKERHFVEGKWLTKGIYFM